MAKMCVLLKKTHKLPVVFQYKKVVRGGGSQSHSARSDDLRAPLRAGSVASEAELRQHFQRGAPQLIPALLLLS